MARRKKESDGQDSELHTWKKRIEAAEKLRDKARDEQGWPRFIDYFKNKWNIDRVPGIGTAVPTIAIVFGDIRTMIANLYFRNPYIAVNPRKDTPIERARLAETDLNYRFGKMKVKREIKKVLQDTGLTGHGWTLVGYAADVKDNDEDETEKGDVDKSAPVTGLKQTVRKEEIFCVHMPWDDVVFDIASKDPPYDCRWTGYSFVKPLEEVKDDPSYKNTAKLKSNVSLREMKLAKDKSGQAAGLEYDMPLVKLYRVFDHVMRETKVLCLQHDGFLKEDGYQYKFDHPLSMLAFNRVNGEPYALSDVYLTEAQSLAKIKIRAQQLNHLKRWNRQLSIEAGTMKPAEKEKLIQGIDGAITERTKGSQPPEPIQYAQIPPETFPLDRQVDDDKTGVLGQTALMSGRKDESQSRTLGEAKMKQMGGQTATEDRLDGLEDYMEEVAAKILSLMQQYQDMTTTAPAPGLDAQTAAKQFGVPPEAYNGHSIAFNKQHISGEMEVDVKAGSSMKMDKQARDQISMELMEIGVKEKILLPNGPVVQAILKDLARDYELPSVEKALEQEMQMVQQLQQRSMGMQDQTHQVETAKKAAETEKQGARAKADLSKADSDKTRAEAEMLKAKAGAIHKAAELGALHNK